MKKLKHKIESFILSHLFKNTYLHFCSIISDCEQLLENKQRNEEEIKQLKEIGQKQENEIISLKELNNINEEKMIEYVKICETKDQQMVQFAEKNLEQELQINQYREKNQKQEIQIKQYEKDIVKSHETILLLNSYILGKEANDFSNMGRFSYECLHGILETNEQIGLEAFKKITSDIYQYNIEVIKNKSKIKIAFLSPLSSTWSCDSLFKKLALNDSFDTYIIVVPFEYGNDRRIIDDEYRSTCDFFDKKKYKYIKSYHLENKKYLTYEEAGAPDVIFHLTPHTVHIPLNFRIDSIHLDVLNVYIPYGYMIVNEYERQFNQKSHHLFWKIFCETPLHKKMAKEHSKIEDINVECSGYVKMDQFLDDSKTKMIDQIWKIHKMNSNPDEIIKVIWAPHHSIFEESSSFGTFHKNFMFFYELAKSRPEISWIVKPHSLLKNHSIYTGVFKNNEEYEDYINKWDELPNARTIQDGNYIDIFKTSDAMILDSVSFLAEYLFTQKPCLFLTSSYNTFNDFGMTIKESHYQTDGNNFDEIENFIDKVLVEKNDSMKEVRGKIYNKYLNFNNGLLASEYIYKYLSDSFNK